jgi:hypothetical protein
VTTTSRGIGSGASCAALDAARRVAREFMDRGTFGELTGRLPYDESQRIFGSQHGWSPASGTAAQRRLDIALARPASAGTRSVMTQSSSSSPPPGHEPPSGHPDVPSQFDPDDLPAGDPEIEQAPGPREGERTGASEIAEADHDNGGVDEGEPTPGDAPADPVDEGDDATTDPNATGEPEPGEMDPTQLG